MIHEDMMVQHDMMATMSESCPTGTIGLLMRLMRKVHARATEEVIGMRLKHVVLLSHLRDVGEEIPQQALGDAVGLDANNLVLMLNELEIEELVERRRDPADRRRHNVAITKAGIRRLEHAEVKLETREEAILAALSPDERAALRSLVAKAVMTSCAPSAADAAAPLAAASR
jgi:DNA-binding MarR family transcriptional regulator